MGYDAPMAAASRPGADELVDLTSSRAGLRLNCTTHLALRLVVFASMLALKWPAKSLARGHTLEKSFANVADIGASATVAMPR
jgi:hypothetical protein